jgi:hypothetical protein
MSKLIDSVKLAKLAKALDERAKAAVAAENERALAAEQAIEAKADANAEAIAAINHAENGLLAQAKQFASAEDAKVAQAAQDANDVLEGRIEVLEGIVTGEEGKTLGQIIEDVAANTDAINKLNGEGEGSVKKQIADAIEPVQGAVDALEAEQLVQNTAIETAQAAADKAQEEVDAVEVRMGTAEGKIAANEQALQVLNGEEEGSVKKQIADAIEPVQGDIDALEAVIGKAKEGEEAATGLHKYIDDADAKALQDAKDYADQQITALVDSAPDAMNTLNELAGAISAHQDVYDAYVAEVSGKLDGKVDKVDNHRLVSETEIAGWNAKAEVSQVNQALQDAKDYTDVEIAKVQKAVDDCEAKDVEQDGRLEILEGLVVGGEGEGLEKIKGDIEKAQEAADKAQEEVDVVEGRMDAVEAEQLVQNQGIADNKAAIEKEVTDRDEAIAKALEDYSTTEEMKVLLGNVVNSLTLTMENDQVVLKLGSEEDGIAITQVNLDMATDADIDAIINGLDA